MADRVSFGHEDATPQRLARAREGGQANVDAAGVRRLADAFDLLRNKQRLDRENPNRNDLLWEAGDRFRRHWHLGRLDGLAAFDFSRESVDGTGGAFKTPPSEAALRHRLSHRDACGVVGPRLLPVLNGVVIEAKSPSGLIYLITDTAHARTAEALVTERLREALDRLCTHWGLQATGKSRPVRHWRSLGQEHGSA